MTKEKLLEIFSGSNPDIRYNKIDTAYAGLKILEKYAKHYIIMGVGADELYSLHIDAALDAGLTEADAVKLFELGWYIKESYFTVYI